MEREIKWSGQAFEDLARILDYLEKDWSHSVATAFIGQLNERIVLLQSFPELGMSYLDNSTARRILITKHNAMYYEFDDSSIVVLKIIDTRSLDYENF